MSNVEILYPTSKQVRLTTGKYDRLSKFETQAYHDPATGCGVVVYRGTPIVSWTPDQVILNTGGWQSRTTKRKMNQASNQFGLGFGVYQVKGNWTVRQPDGQEVPYAGDTVHAMRRGV